MSTLRVLVSFALVAVLGTRMAAQGGEPAPDVERLEREVRVVRDADAVVVARVARVHPSPGVWCGIAVTRQVVTYRVERALAGGGVADTVDVGHLLVANSPQVSAQAPFLSPERFQVGARAMLCLTRDADGGWSVADETVGTRWLEAPRTADPRHAPVVQCVLDLPALQPYLHLEREARRPVCVQLDDVVPLPLAVTAGARPVEFRPHELLSERAYLVFRELSFAGERAQLRFELPAEGVVGVATCELRDRRWLVTSSEVAERRAR